MKSRARRNWSKLRKGEPTRTFPKDKRGLKWGNEEQSLDVGKVIASGVTLLSTKVKGLRTPQS